jgi:hypothetical protein
MHWLRFGLLVFVGAELVLFAYARAASGMAHLRAVQQVTDASPATAASACAEAEGAISDFAPALSILNAARAVPVPTVRAWAQVPRLAEAISDACPPLQVYATVVPWRDASIESGAGADLLAGLRHERPRLSSASQQLTRAWNVLDSVDVHALEADPRLARAARVIDSVRTLQPDVVDALALAAPDRMEAMLGGNGPRSVALRMGDGDASSQAYAVFDQGEVVRIDTGQASAAPVAILSVDRVGLQDLADATNQADVMNGASAAEVSRAVLQRLVRLPVSDYQRIAAILRGDAQQQHASLWFDKS